MTESSSAAFSGSAFQQRSFHFNELGAFLSAIIHHHNIINMTREEFMTKPTTSNKEWVMLQVADLKKSDEYQIRWALKKLHQVLYKSWARSMSLEELNEAMQDLAKIQ